MNNLPHSKTLESYNRIPQNQRYSVCNETAGSQKYLEYSAVHTADRHGTRGICLQNRKDCKGNRTANSGRF